MSDHDPASSPEGFRRVLLLFGIASVPLLVAIWCLPWFLTQDASFHFYNAQISRELAAGNQDFAQVYSQRRGLLPYIAGHELISALDSFLPARVVDRLIMTVTCVGFAALLIWFRWKLAGSGGIELFVPLSLLIAA